MFPTHKIKLYIHCDVSAMTLFLSLSYIYAHRVPSLSLQYLAKRSYCKTALMESLISTYLPADLMERHKVYHEEMAELSK